MVPLQVVLSGEHPAARQVRIGQQRLVVWRPEANQAVAREVVPCPHSVNRRFEPAVAQATQHLTLVHDDGPRKVWYCHPAVLEPNLESSKRNTSLPVDVWVASAT